MAKQLKGWLVPIAAAGVMFAGVFVILGVEPSWRTLAYSTLCLSIGWWSAKWEARND